jgi:hypothetical protein
VWIDQELSSERRIGEHQGGDGVHERRPGGGVSGTGAGLRTPARRSRQGFEPLRAVGAWVGA